MSVALLRSPPGAEGEGEHGPPPPGWWPADLPNPFTLSPEEAVDWLENGSSFRQPEFHLLYERTPEGFKTELVEGIVYVASPLSRPHGNRHPHFSYKLTGYEMETPGVEVNDNTSVIVRSVGETQPDLSLRVRRDHGGRSTTFSVRQGEEVHSDDDGDFLATGPEFALEISKSSRALDLGPKRRDYRAGGVQEYVVADVRGRTLHWFDFAGGTDAPVAVPDDGVLRSRALPGLWLNGPALFARDGQAARATLREGLATPEHAAFVERLAAAKAAHDAATGGGGGS